MKHHNQSHDYGDENLRMAQREVERSRGQVEEALTHLEEKVQQSTDRLQNMIFKAKAPVRFAQQHPMVNMGLFMLAGFFVGTRVVSMIDEDRDQDVTTIGGLTASGNIVEPTSEDINLRTPAMGRISGT